MKNWHVNSWQKKSCQQMPNYPNTEQLNAVVKTLSNLPPLVTPLEIEALKRKLVSVSTGDCFLLQGGDCAESFSETNSETILSKLKIILQMSLILIYGLRMPVVRIGRIAGQYAKPRSNEQEEKNGIILPSYRGDIVNKQEFTAQARIPDPDLLIAGYNHAAQTLNFLRAVSNSGFADLRHAEYWNLDFDHNSPMAHKYQKLVDSISHALEFFKVIPVNEAAELNRVDVYTSHEALNLFYEQALTRNSKENKQRFYNLSTHFPWIGMRTTDIDGAHVEFMRGIANPIAVKIGPTMSADNLLEIINCLNPNNEPGRLTLIHRFGANKIENNLPKLIATVKQAGKRVIWSSDPMHGNTETTKDGIKTRHFDNILSELKQAVAIHKKCGTHLGGVHFEMTGEDVTECIGGSRGLTENDLQYAYKSLVDPRLNYEQALEMAILLVGNEICP